MPLRSHRSPLQRPSRSRFVPVLLGFALVLAACSSTVAGTPVTGANANSGAAGTTGSSGGSATPVPAGLEEFYNQELDWGSCAALTTGEDTKFYQSASLQCADLTVPLVYDDPTGTTITIKVLRKPATDQSARIGSVVINPGGPGASGVEAAGSLGAFGVGKDLNERFDLVGFDPRGVGSSVPEIRCQTDAERDAARLQVVRTRDQADVDAANALAKSIADGCAKLTGAEQGIDGATVLANVGTRDVAKDLDVLRAVLGDDLLTYLGWSYGTAIGTSYAEQFPANVRAMILDGAVDPEEDAATSNIAQTEAFQKAFDDYAAWCAQQAVCVLGKDPANATAVYQSLVRPLLDAPLKLADGRSLSFNDANTGVGQALYLSSFWETLSTALLDLSKGDGSALMTLADLYDGRDADGHYSNLLDAFQAISCIDGSRTIDPAQADQIAAKLAAAAPWQATGDTPLGTNDPCVHWPTPPTGAPHAPEVTGLPEVLVISTTGDPATPYESGVKLADDLGATLLTVEGTNHTAYLGTGNSCVDDIGTDYFIDLALPDDGTTC
ncbi:MAG: alpha/beta hydrolase [Nakamurella sp.]